MPHIGYISDTHLSVPEIESNSLFPRQLAKMDKANSKKLYARMRREIDLAYSTCLKYLTSCRAWDMIVHLGDITSGYDERGCSHPSAQKLILKARDDLENISSRVRFVVGDHDVGYSHRGSLPGSGINEMSLLFLQGELGNLFWADELDGTMHLGVCSPVAQYEGDNPTIRRLQKRQAEFVGDMLSMGNRWVLYTHRPQITNYLRKEIGKHVCRLRRMVCGHYHDPKKGKLIQSATTIFGLPKAKLMDLLVTCPSVAPLWWHGYEFMSSWNHDINPQRVSMTKPSESEDIPTSSFWRCLFWMLKPRAE